MVSELKKYLNIGNNLREIRESYKENQTEFSQRLGISRSTYSNYENNNRLPDDQTLEKIAESLNIKVIDLLGIGTIDSRFSYEDLEKIAQYFDYNKPMGLNFDDEIKKSIQGLSDAGLKLLKKSSVSYFQEYLFKEFGEEYSELLNEFTAKEKQEIYEKTKDYIELLLKAKEKKSK